MEAAQQLSHAIFLACGLATFTTAALAVYRFATRAANAL